MVEVLELKIDFFLLSFLEQFNFRVDQPATGSAQNE